MLSKDGIIHVRTTKRNTILNLVDPLNGSTKFSSSVGCLRDVISAKNNNYTGVKLLSQNFIRKIKEFGYKNISIVFCGLGVGRAALINVIRDSNIKVSIIKDRTLSAHNGCRPKKVRRKKFRTRISFKIKKLLSPGL